MVWLLIPLDLRMMHKVDRPVKTCFSD